jgi:hypothetical protein
MASFASRNPHKGASVPDAKKLLQLSPADSVMKRWESALGSSISFAAKKQFTLVVNDIKFSLADIRLVKQLADKDPDRGSLPLEFFFDGTCNEENLPAFNAAFEQKIEEQLQERRMVKFRKKLAARQRGSSATAEECEALTDDDWQGYLAQKVDPTNLHIQQCREAGCMLIFTAIRASLSISACETLGELSFPEYFCSAVEADEMLKDEKNLPMPRWVYFMLLILLVSVLSAVYALSAVVRGMSLH